jgi:hypothetical protein
MMFDKVKRVRAGLLLVGCVTACGSVGSKPDAAGVHDAPATHDAMKDGSPDAPVVCNPTAAFGAPVVVSSLNSTGDEGPPRFSADELQAVFNRTNANSSDSDLYIASRSSTSTDFQTPTPITEENTTSNEYNPVLSSDALTMFFDSTRSSGVHIWVTTRATTLASFAAPSLAAGVNSSAVDGQSYLTADGQELWLASTRTGGLGANDIYRAVKSGNAFGTPVAVTALSSASEDYLPVVSADKLTVYFTSDRAGGMGDFDIWMSHRSTTSDGFPTPTVVTELNSAATEYSGWLSPDNCRLYFASNRGGNFDIYVATRQP